MASSNVFVESASSGNGGRENLYFEKGETYPRCAGKAGDLTVLSDKLGEKLPTMLIVNSRISVQKKDGFLVIEDIIRLVSTHNWNYRSNPVRKLIFNRCEDVDTSKAKLESMVKHTGTEIDVAITNMDEKFITDVFTSQVDAFTTYPEKPLKDNIEYGVAQHDLGYYGFDAKFIYSTLKF